jgi:hypothetical protein
MTVTPLPYVDEAVMEVKYALEELGAVGVSVLTNHEGIYPGDEGFDGLWGYLQGRAETGEREVAFVHPTEPVIRLDEGRLVNSRPCKSSDSTTFLPNRMFYRDTRRADMRQHRYVRALVNFTSKPHAQSQA